MEALLGTSLDVWIGITLVLTGGASFMMGQAIAQTWRPVWQVLAYGLLLACVSRFFVYALFDGSMLSITGYIADTVVLLALGLLAYRWTRVKQMVTQYPWLYVRAGPFGYRGK